ncbi:MAG: helix-turn-helix domain-containing protein [Bacteroidota bacterium]|nr:helix-turn-helix domain-containing protein [Bacteroidota bacterium]
MTEILFTTADVSQMLQVDKSTVKRWTDEGKLKCFRTPGGHRKFRAEDLYQFMSEFNYGVTPMNLYPQFASDEAVLRRIIMRKEYNVLASVCFNSAIQGKQSDVAKLFSEVYRNGLALPLIFDEVLRPTLKRIKDLNKARKISDPEMQLANNALSGAIILFSDTIIKPASSGKSVLCCAVEGDDNQVDLKALAVLLESEGFDVLNLGVAPLDSVLQLVESRQPHHVYIHVSEFFDLRHLAAAKEAVAAYDGKIFALAYSPVASVAFKEAVDKICTTFKEITAVQHDFLVKEEN